MQYLTILGSTGSIGRSTLSVIQQNLDKFSLHALIAYSNVSLMTQQCLKTNPKYACMIHKNSAKILKNNLISLGRVDIQVFSGMKHACELVALDEVDMIMSAIVGIAGLQPTFAALRAKKKILLANKEILVACGSLFMREIYQYKTQIIPVDSEHNAIFQSLPIKFQKNLGQAYFHEYNISKVILTASGGIFFKVPKEKLSTITPEQACIHPNWSMGKKISVDSATMMNKGLEYIEARYLFNATSREIEILLHPQSIVHSMIYYHDGTVLMNLSIPDMKLPIAYAMAYPDRITLKNTATLNINDFNKLRFDPLDVRDYPCLRLAIDVSNDHPSASVILNAANEVAVAYFLNRIISFDDIPSIIRCVLDKIDVINLNDIEDVLYIDRKAREQAVSMCIMRQK